MDNVTILVENKQPSVIIEVKDRNTVFSMDNVNNMTGSKTTPINVDNLTLWDSVVGKFVKLTWANTKATLKTYFDTLYASGLGADDNYVTDAEKVVIGNTSGANSGDQDLSGFVPYIGATGNVALGTREISAKGASFGDISGGNYTEIEDDGTVRFHGDATVWDDIRTPANNAKAVAGKEAKEQAYKGGVVYKFEDGVDEAIAFNVQLPHKYKLGTDLEFHIHFALPSSGGGVADENIKFDFTYALSNIGDVIPTETSATATRNVKDDVLDTHYLMEITNSIDGSSIDNVSSMLICSLTRDVSVANNYADDVYVMEVDFHYQIDTMGSREEYSK